MRDNRLAEHFKAKSSWNDRESVYSYKKADDYRRKLSHAGVSLEIPDYVQTDFEEIQNRYVESLYAQGQNLLAGKSFEEAQQIFTEINALVPNYANTSDLERIARCEPLYTQARLYMDRREYRKAYNQLQEIAAIDYNYKDIHDLENECLRLGIYTVSLAPFENRASRTTAVESDLQAQVLSALKSLNDPFLKIVERDNLDAVLEEQKLSLSGIVDQNSAARVGQLLGAKALLSATVTQYSEVRGRLIPVTAKGYESYQVKRKNPETGETEVETRYKPADYIRYSGGNAATIRVQFKLLSLESGEVLAADDIYLQQEDQVNFAEYNGEFTRLVPARGNSPLTSRAEVNSLHALFRARRNPMEPRVLGAKAVQEASSKMVSAIGSYVNSLP